MAKQTLLLSYLQATTWQASNGLFGRLTAIQAASGSVNVTLVTLFRQNATSVSYPQARSPHCGRLPHRLPEPGPTACSPSSLRRACAACSDSLLPVAGTVALLAGSCRHRWWPSGPAAWLARFCERDLAVTAAA